MHQSQSCNLISRKHWQVGNLSEICSSVPMEYRWMSSPHSPAEFENHRQEEPNISSPDHWLSYGAFHGHGGDPFNGWFIVENPTKMGWFGGTPMTQETSMYSLSSIPFEPWYICTLSQCWTDTWNHRLHLTSPARCISSKKRRTRSCMPRFCRAWPESTENRKRGWYHGENKTRGFNG